MLLVASEMVTNAVRHAGGAWTMHVTVRPSELVIEVTDGSPVLPASREPDLTGVGGGMGMHIIAELASRLETELLPAGRGKTIRAIWEGEGS